jgi:hypothetical protein
MRPVVQRDRSDFQIKKRPDGLLGFFRLCPFLLELVLILYPALVSVGSQCFYLITVRKRSLASVVRR